MKLGGDTLAYRRFGNTKSEVPPLLFLQHFRGNLDTWDPALVDGLAREREVVLLDNRGVGASTVRLRTTSTTWPATCCDSSTRSD